MSFDQPQHPHPTPASCRLPDLAPPLRFIWLPFLALALLACAVAPGGADVLFPHDYGNGEMLTFSGGTPGKDYDLRVAKPGGGIVKASEALLDVSFLDHGRVKIAPLNATPDVYRAFYGPSGGGGSTQVLAAVYVAGTDRIVDHTLVINTTYDPSPHFQGRHLHGKPAVDDTRRGGRGRDTDVFVSLGGGPRRHQELAAGQPHDTPVRALRDRIGICCHVAGRRDAQRLGNAGDQ